MCRFLTIATPRPIDLPESLPGLCVELYHGGGGGHTYDHTLIPYSITNGGCSCDLVLAPSREYDPEEELRKLQARYEKKGWSTTKVNRAVADHQKAARARPPIRSDLLAFLSQLVGSQGKFELILHWHSGSFLSEPFLLRETRRINCIGVLPPFTLEEDTRYEFTKRDA